MFFILAGKFPSVVSPAPPVEAQLLSRTPSWPLHMLTGGSGTKHSAAVPGKEKEKIIIIIFFYKLQGQKAPR